MKNIYVVNTDEVALKNSLPHWTNNPLVISAQDEGYVIEVDDTPYGDNKPDDAEIDNSDLERVFRYLVISQIDIDFLRTEIQGFAESELLELGFELAYERVLGDEYHGKYSDQIADKMHQRGIAQVWGHEGGIYQYAVFRCDNPDHEDCNKLFISIYSID